MSFCTELPLLGRSNVRNERLNTMRARAKQLVARDGLFRNYKDGKNINGWISAPNDVSLP